MDHQGIREEELRRTVLRISVMVASTLLVGPSWQCFPALSYKKTFQGKNGQFCCTHEQIKIIKENLVMWTRLKMWRDIFGKSHRSANSRATTKALHHIIWISHPTAILLKPRMCLGHWLFWHPHTVSSLTAGSALSAGWNAWSDGRRDENTEM